MSNFCFISLGWETSQVYESGEKLIVEKLIVDKGEVLPLLIYL